MNTEVKKVDNGSYPIDDYMRVPIDRTGWEKLRLIIHNPEEGSYLGRTPSNWARLILFYAIFYSVLAVLCAVCYAGLISSVDKADGKPKWTLQESIIGTSPGLGFQPMSMNTEDRALIKYNPNSEQQVRKWTEILDIFFKNYTENSAAGESKANRMECTNDEKHDLCKVNVTQFGPCISSNKYGFQEHKPCVFIKLNRIYGWVPEFYDNAEELPNNMPPQLKKHIKDLKATSSPLLKNTIWVSCEDATTKEPLQNVEYFPKNRQGFPGYYYPYKNVAGYLSPLVAVKFSNLPANKEIKIACRAWAKNIQYSNFMKDNSGIVRFELKLEV